MRFPGWLLTISCAVASLMIACGDSSGPSGVTAANIVLESGDGQTATEVGTRLPLPLAVKVSDAQGNPLSGVTVVWSTAFGTLSAPTTLSNAAGIASVEWTLGTVVGRQTATATASGLAPVTFSVGAVAGALSEIILSRDSVTLLGVGDTFRLNARPVDRFGNSVDVSLVVESSDPASVTADNFGGGAILTAHAFDKTISVRVTAGTLVRLATVIVMPPPCGSSSSAVSLSVGQIALFPGSAASEFCVQGTASGAEFIAMPYYSDFTGNAVRISISTGNTTIGAAPTRLITPGFQIGVASTRPKLARADAFEIALRARSINELTPLFQSARKAKQLNQGRFSFSVASPVVGELLDLNTNTSSACSNPRLRTGRVAAITNRAIVVADTANPANGFTAAEFQHFGALFDTLIYPVDTLNFGGPTDIDRNQRVILFFTRAVNELTPPNVNFYVSGFFFTRDLYPTTTNSGIAGCTASNFGEMVYLLVPDAAGSINQNVRTSDFVQSSVVATLAHEFQHLINASRHLYVNMAQGTFEETFLDEGLAHEAEELAFYRSSGLSPRQNVSYDMIHASSNTQRAFDDFGAANFRRFNEYLTTPFNSPYIDNSDITTRGAIWSFLRYAADRRGGEESQMWFQLANPPAGVHGIANITRAVTPDLGAWVRDWTVANYADDFVAGTPSTATHPSWNIRSVVEVVNQGMWALATRQLETTSITSVTIPDGTSAYLRFGVSPGSVGGGRITARGAVVPPGFALSVLRTK